VATAWVINLYDGANDIPLGYVNPSDDSAGFLSRAVVTTKTASASIALSEREMLVAVTASTANIALALPTAITAKNGFRIRFQKRDNTAFTVTVSRGGTDLINGATSYVLNQQYDTVEMVTDGVSAWYAYGGILDGSINTDKIANNAITSGKIADGAVTSAKLAAAVLNQLLPPASLLAYAGSAVPTGWLLCHGQAVSRATFATLYTALGGAASSWGQGDGSTTFNVPDLRGRVIAGLDAMGGVSANRLLATRTISIASISQSGTTVTVNTNTAHGLDPGGTFAIAGAGNAAFNGTWTVSSVNRLGSESTRASQQFTFTRSTSASISAVSGGTITASILGGVDGSVLGAAGGASTHTLTEGQLAAHNHRVYYNRDSPSGGSGDTADHSHNPVSGSGPYSTTTGGGDGPHNNVQPTVVTNYLIKT
jgi:microcystin-dependent protein